MPTRPWKTQSLGRNQPSDFGSVISTSYKFSFKWATWLWCYNSRRHRAYLLKIVSWVFQDTVQKDHKPLKALPPLFVWIVSTLFERHYWLKVSATESFKSTTTEFNVMLPALKWQVKTNSQILIFFAVLEKNKLQHCFLSCQFYHLLILSATCSLVGSISRCLILSLFQPSQFFNRSMFQSRCLDSQRLNISLDVFFSSRCFNLWMSRSLSVQLVGSSARGGPPPAQLPSKGRATLLWRYKDKEKDGFKT